MAAGYQIWGRSGPGRARGPCPNPHAGRPGKPPSPRLALLHPCRPRHRLPARPWPPKLPSPCSTPRPCRRPSSRRPPPQTPPPEPPTPECARAHEPPRRRKRSRAATPSPSIAPLRDKTARAGDTARRGEVPRRRPRASPGGALLAAAKRGRGRRALVAAAI
nr:sulfated surface glycoprotein 185-like [Lolium perenne]